MTRLHESGTAVTDANGRAAISLAPYRAFERWTVTRMTVQCDGTKVPKALVYRGHESASALIDGTYTGSLNHSDTNIVLENAEALIFVFDGADPGVTATVTVEGESTR